MAIRSPLIGSTSLTLAVLMTIATASYAGPVTNDKSLPYSAYIQPHRLVSIRRDQRLDLFCLGSGGPAVIFIYGAGGGLWSWRSVQGAVSSLTTACSYDRAGFGFSDPPRRPSDANSTVGDLHRLLSSARIATPVILVGHSIGGLYATLYAETYPNEVSGMVLIDPDFAGQMRVAAKWSAAAQAVVRRGSQMALSAVERCLHLAQAGDTATESKECPVPNPGPAFHAELERERGRVSEIEAYRSELSNAVPGDDWYSKDDRELMPRKGQLGSMPLVVLTAGRHPPIPGISHQEFLQFEAAWKAGHDRLARLSNTGINIIVPDSGHAIQMEKPDVVINCIRQVFEEVRRHSK